MEIASSGFKDRTRYQGKNLGLLLLAMGLPAAMLYLRILLGTLVGYSRGITGIEIGRLTFLSNLTLGAFVVIQVLCARYIQRLVPPRNTDFGRFVQYLAVLALCVLLSVTGAVVFEAFGVTLLLRTGHV